MKLIEHRRALAKNSEAYTYELADLNIERLVRSLIPHLKKAGFRVSLGSSRDQLSEIIRLLFNFQDERPFFHVEGTELPLCWNSPKDWDKDYIKYEWGHLRSRNREMEGAHHIENLGLYSARCNQHI